MRGNDYSPVVVVIALSRVENKIPRIRQAVWSCYQEEPVEFEGQQVYDMVAFPGLPLSGRITDRVTQPWRLPKDEKEKQAVKRMQAMVKRFRRRNEKHE